MDQEIILDEAITNVKQCAIDMERWLDKGQLTEAIHSASEMLLEMTTSKLSPKAYYELYMSVTDKLRLLEAHLLDAFKDDNQTANLYEEVQYIPCVVPRLYLMITVGVHYIKCAKLSRKEIMVDLVDMCAGVQHPLRGLFLRSYLVAALRTELLPAISDDAVQEKSPTESEPKMAVTSDQGTITDSVNFLLRNFTEMNKLWVRMQHQGHSRDKERREQERRELRLLVGINLNRLSQLEFLDAKRYKEQVLPRLLEQLIECRDPIAQEYLMDVIIQVFPAEYNLAVLPEFLRICKHLQPAVKIKQIISGLMKRLTQYLSTELSDPSTLSTLLHDVNVAGMGGDEAESDSPFSTAPLFALFLRELKQLIGSRVHASQRSPDEPICPQNLYANLTVLITNGLPPEDIPAMFSSLVNLAMLLYPEQASELVDECLSSTAEYLEQIGVNRIPSTHPLSQELLRLMHLPLGGHVQQVSSHNMSTNSEPNAPASSSSIELKRVLSMTGFRRLLTLLDPKTTKGRLACSLLNSVLERDQSQRSTTTTTTPDANKSRLTSEEDVDGLFELIDCLLVSHHIPTEDADEFGEIQSLVAGTLHLIGTDPRTQDPDLCYRLLCKAQIWLAQSSSLIVRWNYPVLVFEALLVIQAYAELSGCKDAQSNYDEKLEKIVAFVHRCITKLVACDAPEIAIRLFLKAALVIDQINFTRRESMAYEFVSQALTLYEEALSKARAQVDAITLIISTLCQMRGFSPENRQTLRTQCSRSASRLLHKHDQSRAIAQTAHLHWPVRLLERRDVKASIMITMTGQSTEQHTAVSEAVVDNISDAELDQLRDGKAALECLNRANRLAQDCMDDTVKAQLYLNTLDHGLTLQAANCTEVTEDLLKQWVEEVEKLTKSLPPSVATEELQRHLSNTVRFMLRHERKEPTETAEHTPIDPARELFAPVE